ncbi:hypothetical protein C1752_03241 [Acaryochloris thomasi RCC1774]|uniref:Uncharacterized protein n=1 Tax=Acaryochloris thomasi RCC1774 TaxID=1764569 RepID=A0A2W1JH39_9CYAN|nr:hypothetical protein C1752_03241 [Acaryochloris thomasi RCC1774]
MSMTKRSLNLLALFTSVNAVGLILPTLQAAEAAPKPHNYNPALVAIYTSSCMKQLNRNPDAKKACQCSVREMQKHHAQTQAVAIVKKAKSSSSVDPSTGVPNGMSKYFAPCL